MGSRSELFLGFVVLVAAFAVAAVLSQSPDADVMLNLRKSIKIPATSSISWEGSDPCTWSEVECASGRVTKIQIGKRGITGTLPGDIGNLTALTVFEVMENGLGGALPNLSGMASLQRVLVNGNGFTSIPSDFFAGMNSLDTVSLDDNPFSPFPFPASLKDSSNLRSFSAINCTISGPLPDIFSSFPSLTVLRLSFNSISGQLPPSFAGSPLQTLWINGQNGNSRLNGPLSVLQNMTELTQVWLHGNSFSGQIPDLSALQTLREFSVRDNSLTGPVPESLTKIDSLQVVNLTNNLLQGPTPEFAKTVEVDAAKGTNSFCLDQPGAGCDDRVNVLLAIAKDFGYPTQFGQDWKDNNPCNPTPWRGISCVDEKISVLNFQKMGLSGTISPLFSNITTLHTLILSGNNLTGTIPDQLTALAQLKLLDVSDNRLYGKVPKFGSNVQVNTAGNDDIGKDIPPPPPPSTTSPPSPPNKRRPSPPGATPTPPTGGAVAKKSSTGLIVGAVVGAILAIAGLFGIIFCCFCRTEKKKKKKSGKVRSPNAMVIHPRHSGDGDAVKITVTGSGAGGGASESFSVGSSAPSGEAHIIESSGNLTISIQVLKSVTNNFSESNILGRGGFGTVYGGELHDGTKIAVKRMESGAVGETGLGEFKSEISVLTKVRHRHLVALLGYCLDGNEKLLVYEYMPQGTLSRYLFDWKAEGLKPLEWMKRITIALDVARGVEYLHGLAQQSFIHRDLKPSNILLGDDMRAKVSDFGLVRLAPDGKASIVTRLAGTFGYLAPEYAVTGRVTTKIDVFSFGVILMELITGRKALDESQPEESVHLVPWFRRMQQDKQQFRGAVDAAIDLGAEEVLASVGTVAELAGHCCARDPHQRPDMSHAVNVLSSLTEMWRPTEPSAEDDDFYGVDVYDLSLPQAIKKWQALEGLSGIDTPSYLDSSDNTQTSIPTRPTGFADSFTSVDGR